MKEFFLFILAVLIVIAGPLAVIFSLNTLFPALAIPVNFFTWLSTFVLMATVYPKGIK